MDPPFIPLDDFFALDKHRSEDATAHRRFGVDPDTARFFGWTVERAESAPDSHYDDVIRRFVREWGDSSTRLPRARRPTTSSSCSAK
jgi:hypothetical protein